MNLIFRKSQHIGKLFTLTCYHQHRQLSLQEHISYALLNEYGIKTPRFGEAKTAKEAEKVARDLLTKNLIVKAQVLSGGRGKGKFRNGITGGVHSATR